MCFTPGEDCAGAVVAEIDSAKTQVLVQAYSFTSHEIADALTRARRRGIEVRVIVDKSQSGSRYEQGVLDKMAEAGVALLVDRAHAIAHNKVMVIDDARVITGSFNFTEAAQSRNAENLLVLRDAALAARYEANWQAHARHSNPWEQRQALR